jgi:hypothetical protein
MTLLVALGRAGGERRGSTLREFRSSVLSASGLGRSVVRAYSRLSPSLVRWVGVARWRKDLVYHLLVRPASALAARILAVYRRERL